MLKKGCVVLLVLLSAQVWAHGDIESIKCFDSVKKIKLLGTRTSQPLQFKISVEKKGKAISRNRVVSLLLEDSVDPQNQSVIENIKFKWPEELGEAHLKIRETPEEVRKGFGSLKMNKNTLSERMLCIVKY